MDVPTPPLRYQKRGLWQPMPLHRVKGRSIRLISERGVAMRIDSKYSGGDIFTANPLLPGEELVVQVLSAEERLPNVLEVGLTPCDPATMRRTNHPPKEDLLKQLCNWAVGGSNCPEDRGKSECFTSDLEVGDEIGFHITPSGEVRASKNGAPPATVTHVDHTLRFWAYIILFGGAQKENIKIRIMQRLPAAAPPKPPMTKSAKCGPDYISAEEATMLAKEMAKCEVQHQPAADGGTILGMNLPRSPQWQNQASQTGEILPPPTSAVPAPGPSAPSSSGRAKAADSVPNAER